MRRTSPCERTWLGFARELGLMAATVASSVGATLSLSLVAGGFGDDLKHARTMAAWPWPRFPSRSRMASSHLLKKNRGYAKLKKLDIAKFNIDQTNEKGNTEREKLEERGVWLPSAPRIEKLRAFYNASSLAYLGDAVFELYARRHFFVPPQMVETYNNRVMELVCCEAQDALLRQLLKEEFLSDEERDVVRWGRNATVGKGRQSDELVQLFIAMLHPLKPW
ncbi:hypothetical protein O6H91_14G040200 [Diphasiastrum complanatum]|uniref:Uncharacterized protein n=1 Tax=Diphasiastrum complanatum TaxID=34168 RepID=A0ACC2BNG4_DIPCM|nr:hypothetical protein O6H91_14G040200 [Diphasiastrum complanatum]